jgi:adenosylcobinamide-GDP ribazoletransferase
MTEEGRLTFKDRFLSALGFITVIPAGGNYTYSPQGMTSAFPMVGLLVGTLLACSDVVFRTFWNPMICGLLDVIFLIAITGAFHLDGLADTADGLFSHRPKERMLEIMKDSRIGAMGVVALITVLSLKWAALSSLPETGVRRFLILALVPAYARSGLVFGIRFLPYGRTEGTGKGHFDKKLNPGDFMWMAVPAVLSLGLGFKAVLFNGAFVLTVFGVITYYRRKMGCVTGDMLGAMAEIGEAVLFIVMATGDFLP